MIITGGNDHGIALCNKGQIFAWGYNDGNRLCLLDPADAAKSIVPSPSQVNTGDLTFSQLSGGSGGHSVALACNKVVYCWGSNDGMQCGRPKSDYITGGKPVPVYKGVTDGYNLDGKPGGDYLGNVKYISATTNASMAILDDGTGRVVIWGTNKDNIFGAPTYEPVWLTDENKQPIRNVIHITGGDDNIMLIVGDSPDALVGTVYSGGNWNGRGAELVASDAIFAPVEIGDGKGKKGTGEKLTNVRTSGLSDVGGFAVDGTTGYVYGWGNAWGCMNGYPTLYETGTAYAEKVGSGEYKEISGESYLTNVKQVVGGNGNGTAVTQDGYVLYWGSNEAAKISDNKGGVIPNSDYSTVLKTCATGPVFANYCAGEKGAAEVRVDDAVAIARGDLYGFMVNSNGDFYVWGSTARPGDGVTPMHVGTLGIGQEKYVSTCFKKIDIDKLCDPQDLCPEAFMVPSRQKCPGEKINLYSGFTPAINREDNYYFYWEKDGVPLNTSTKSSSAADRKADAFNKYEIEIVDPGVYKVIISYVGLNVPCDNCPDDSAEIEITDMPMPIDTIITDMNCVANPRAPSAGDKISFEAVVNNKFYKATDNVTFAAFSTPTSTDTIRIVKTTGAGGQILLPNISGDSVLQVNDNAATTGDTTYSIWLEDITSFETYLFKGAALSAGGNDQKQGLMIEIFSMAHLQSFDVAAKTYYGPGTFTAKPQIYSVDVNDQGNPIKGALYWEGDAQPFDITDVASTHTVVCDVKLPANPSRGTRYILAVALTGSSFQPMQMALNVTQPNNAALFATPIADSEGFGISAVGSLEGTNPGKTSLITNIKFGKLTDYDCGRIELQARLGCPPCNPLDPTSVKIEVSDQTVVKNDTIFLCQESPAVTLSVSAVKGAPSAEAGAKFDILWYKKSLASAAAQTDSGKTASTFATPIAWDATKAGTSEKIYLQARDNKEPDSECHEEDSIVIVYNEIPVAPAIADMQFCVNAATADKPNLNDTLQTAKFSDFVVTWTSPTAIPDLQGADGATAGTKTYEYTVTSKSTGCVSAAATFDVTVLDKPVAPTVKNLDFVVTPNTTEKVEQGATATTGHTLTWYDNASKSVYPAPGSSASPTVTLDAEKQESFWVAQISDIGGCISDTVRIDVTVNDAPVPDAVNDTVCLGISVDVTKLVTVGDQRNPNDRYVPVWYNDFGANKEDSVSASAVMMDPNNPGEQLFYVAQKNLATGAISNKKTFAVYVYGVYKPTVDKSVINYCAKDPATVLTANQMKNENDGYMADDFVWTLDGRGVNSPLPDTDVTNDTSYTYRVHQIYTIPTDQNQVCVGDSVEVTVNVTHVPQLTVGSVLYLKSDANASGSFDNNLMQQNTGLITGNMEQGATLNWYESDCATPVPGTPTPTVDSSIPTGVDQNVTYCVSQTVNGCEGEKIKVDVKISDAMPPTVEHLIYCEGSVIEDLTAKVSTLPGENESDFELLWYRNQPADVNAAYDYYGEATDKFAMNSQIASVTNSAVTVTSYWVAQRNKSTQAVSTATELKVIVYPKPVVITTAPDAICGNDGNVLELNANPAIWSVANEADLKANSIATITPQFFDGQGNSLGASSAVNASGTYSIGATYNVTSTLGGVNIKDNTCTGDPVQVAVQVHYLSDLSITGVNSTCPSTKVTLTASATSTDPGVISYVWGGDGAGATGDTYTTPTLTERINNQGTQIPYSYTVQATAGKCVLDVATPHEVVIGDGPVIGNMTIAETGNSEAPITFTGDVPREFYSCGGEVMLTVDFTKTAGDYTWFDETGNQVGTGATYTVPATQFTVDRKYRLEYTNQCPTFTEVTIKAVPLTAKALQKGDIVLCEGEPFMVSMEYACLENPSIQWYRDGSMIGSIEKEMKIEKTIVSDGGLYSFVAKNRGCTVSDTAYNLVVKPYIQVTDIADPLVIARGGNQSITLPITVPANGLVQSISWKENGAEVYNGNPYTLTDVRVDHYYDIFLDDPNHCSDTTEITVWVDAELQLSTTLKDTICLGATETLVIDTTGTGAFRQFNVTPSLIVTEESDGNIMDITDKIQKVGNLLNIPVAPKVNTTYKVEFSYGNQFVSSTEFAVVIPAIEVTTPAIPTICEGEQVKLQVTDIKPIGTSVSWVSDPTIIDGQNSEILTVQPVYTGGVNHQSVYVYTLMATNSICGTSKPYEVKVKVDEPITGNISGVNAICEGQSTVLDASSFQAGTYSWSTNGSAVGVMDVINVSPAATATYELSMTRGLCSASASYTVLVSTNPVIMRIDSVALRDREIILDPSYGTAPFTYAIDSREPDVNSIKENLSFTSHIAKVVDAAGCQTSVQFSMEPPAITIPEHFSPNGDGINDTWVCPSLADVYPNSLVSIYDRYGKLLVQFLGADADGWDGTYMGVDMPSTDYWYQIDIEEINRQYVGHFTLIRR
jgi:gliding motility-associated-like protein